jgi:hypothetical protein
MDDTLAVLAIANNLVDTFQPKLFIIFGHAEVHTRRGYVVEVSMLYRE